MVWKTNFDASDYGDVLKTEKSGKSSIIPEDGTHQTLVGQHTEIVQSFFLQLRSMWLR